MGLAERGVRRPPGWMGEEAFLRIAMRFLPGRQPRRAVARAVQWPIETVRTYRQTRILRFMSVPTSPAARLTTMAERVSLRRCGPATSLLSISSQLPTAIKRRASSTPVFMPLVADQATAAVFMTLTAGATAIRQQTGTTWRSEEHTSELQSRGHLVCRLLLEKK